MSETSDTLTTFEARTIRRRVSETLFSGRTAQPVYEAVHTAICRDACRDLGARQSAVFRPAASPVIVTSLAPGNRANQRRAMRSWQDAGFKVVSVNARDEIALLREHFDIDFIAAPRDARQRYGKPYIYFDDLLAYFRHREDIAICGIVNSDIHLTAPDFRAVVEKEAKGAFIYGSRLDVDASDPSQGEMYQHGFDYFFFDRKVLPLYPPQNFCLGLPWWDYWAVLVPLMHKVPVTLITAPVAAHLRHKAMWDKKVWLELGAALAANFKPPYEVGSDNMLKFANDTLWILKKLSARLGVGAADTGASLTVRRY